MIRVLVASTLAALVVAGCDSRPGTGPFADLTSGSPAASTQNLIKNGNFTEQKLLGWSQRKTVQKGDNRIPEAAVEPGAGRQGTGGLLCGPASAINATVAQSHSLQIQHADFFLDGFMNFKPIRGKCWAGIEFVFEDSVGNPVASYLAWKGSGGVTPPVREKGLVVEMAPSEKDWTRIPIHTTYDLSKQMALTEPVYNLTVNLWLVLEDGEAVVSWDDVELRDMKAGR